jgi:hypothetical protein
LLEVKSKEETFGIESSEGALSDEHILSWEITTLTESGFELGSVRIFAEQNALINREWTLHI